MHLLSTSGLGKVTLSSHCAQLEVYSILITVPGLSSTLRPVRWDQLAKEEVIKGHYSRLVPGEP